MSKITIFIPTFNRSGYLDKAINSALSQTHEDVVVVVSDNASTDDTEIVSSKYVSDSRFIYFRHPENIGMVRNWRYALDNIIDSEYVLILSDDDELIDCNYLKDVSVLLGREKCDLVFSNGKIEYVDKGVFKTMEHHFSNGVQNGDSLALSKENIKPQAFTLCNVVFNVETLRKLGAFNNPDNLICDSEMFLSICFSGVVGYLDNVSSLYRRHSSNLVDTLNKKPAILLGCLDYVATPYSILCGRNDHSSKNTRCVFFNKFYMPTIRSVFVNLMVSHGYSIFEAIDSINNCLSKKGMAKYRLEMLPLVKVAISKIIKLF
jgi:glycosyltransferase involved in cell wall biosynthesis